MILTCLYNSKNKVEFICFMLLLVIILILFFKNNYRPVNSQNTDLKPIILKNSINLHSIFLTRSFPRLEP